MESKEVGIFTIHIVVSYYSNYEDKDRDRNVRKYEISY